MSRLQAVMFNKKYNTRREASRWLAREGLQPIKAVHTTPNFYRYRIAPPVGEMRTMTLDPRRQIKGVVIMRRPQLTARRGGLFHMPTAQYARSLARRRGGAIGSDLGIGAATVGAILAGIIGKKIYDHVRR